MSIDLSRVLKWLDLDTDDLGVKVRDLCLDSRKIKPGDVFIALCGDDNHGIDFAYQVQRGGACAILAESVKQDKAIPKSRQQPLSIPVIEINNLSEKLGNLSANFYQHPSEKIKIIGITGTNGKTSCAWLLLQAWSKLGIKAGYIGTLGYGTANQINELANTTPTALELQKLLADFVNKGITHMALEVSSHGLALGRVNGIKFNGAAYTNISRDHLDFHKSMEEYANTKKSLFTQYETDFAVINSADSYAKQWATDITVPTINYASNTNADIFADSIELHPQGISFKLYYNNQSYSVSTNLLGHFNVDNILLVIATLLQQDITIDKILSLIAELKPVPGRMNRIETPINSPLIIVDYAHTPDAIKQVLMALKQHNARNIWCIFGCGGNRDKGKRPQMGYIAETLADHVIITDDNPRYEDNKQITKNILMGMKSNPQVINSRKDAIAYAISHAHADDLILIAGKGHENYQLINGVKHKFDDRLTAAELLATKGDKCA